MTNQNSAKSKYAFIAAMFIYLLPAIILIIHGSTFSDSLLKKIGVISISASLFFIPFIFFKQKTAFLINSIAVLFSPIEIIHILFFKTSVDTGLIMLALQTDFHEVIELLLSFWQYLFFILLIFGLYISLVFRYINNTYLFSNKTRIIYFSILLTTVFSLYSYCLYLAIQFKNQDISIIKVANNAFKLKLGFLYPYNLINSFVGGIELNEDVNTATDKLKDFKFGSKSNNEVKKKEIYVLIIGESARFSNFSLNGYNRKTSPNLDTTTNIISFKNIFSEANNTQISVPILLTRATALNFEIGNMEKSVVDAFYEAGFSTYWIANQSARNPFTRRIFQSCSESFVSTKDFDSFENYDGNLLPFLDKILTRNEKKQFIVIHTLGSHFRYNFRYPTTFRFFKPDFEGSVGYDLINKKNKTKLINSYDNSIRYTDFFISTIINKIKSVNSQSYILYVSDHAENLLENGIALHGSTPTNYSLHVPLFIWYSKEFELNNSKKVLSMKNNTDKRQSTSIVFHSLLDLANISTTYLKKRKSICSDSIKSDTILYALSPNKKLYTFKFVK